MDEKIGFFGGCFNPPTNIHIQLANNLIEDEIINKVIFVPVGDYYEKQDLILAHHRYNMLKIVCKTYQNLMVENIASIHKDKLYATDTFELIYNKYKNDDIYFIMGSDNFKKMPNWKNYTEIIKKYKFIVMERLKYEEKNVNVMENVIYYRTNETGDVSSSKIRNLLKNNQNIERWVNREVIEYIKQNKLYFIR